MNQIFQQRHGRNWEHNQSDPWERRRNHRGKGVLLLNLRQMGRWNQYQTGHYHQAKFAELVGLSKIRSFGEFEQHQGQRVGE
jgi:hypothetical protein